MIRVTLWFNIEKSFGTSVLRQVFFHLDLASGTVTECIGEMYCIEFRVTNTLEEIQNVERYLIEQYNDIDLKMDTVIG